MLQNGQTEPDGVRVYSERFGLFAAKRHLNQEKSNRFLQTIKFYCF